MSKMATIYTDQAGEQLWLENNPFIARKEMDKEKGYVYPIVVHCYTIRQVGTQFIEVRKWEKL